jgi:diketogulonate reductase-like aldo/keto reductase
LSQALEELRKEGKIKMIGVSNFGKRDLTEAVAHKV